MMDITKLVGHIKRSHPFPQVNLEWARECAEALIREGVEVSSQQLLEQYLHSDLAISASPTLPTTLANNQTLFPSPTLLQITSLTDIGASAIAIQNTLEQRRDVLQGRTRIRGMDEQEGEEEIEPGKLPEYPRSMLKLGISDGRAEVKAIEYKRIPGLKLGDTKLGCKVVLHNVKIVNSTLLLSPQNTKVVGRYVDDMEDIQAGQFIDSLKQRLIDARDPPKISAGGKAKLPRGKPITSSRVKPERQTQGAMEIKSSPYFGQNATAGPSRPSRGPVSASARGGRPSLPISVVDSEDDDARERARRARAAAILGSTSIGPASARNVEDESDDEYGFVDPNESFFDHLDAVEATATQRQDRRTRGGPSSRYGHDENADEEDDWGDADIGDEVYRPAVTGSRQTTSNGKAGRGSKRVYQEIDDTDQDEDYGFDDDGLLAGIDEPLRNTYGGSWNENRVSHGNASRYGSGALRRSSEILDGGTQDQPIEISD